jgi:Ca2+-binding RTX toxin-like protein
MGYRQALGGCGEVGYVIYTFQPYWIQLVDLVIIDSGPYEGDSAGLADLTFDISATMELVFSDDAEGAVFFDPDPDFVSTARLRSDVFPSIDGEFPLTIEDYVYNEANGDSADAFTFIDFFANPADTDPAFTAVAIVPEADDGVVASTQVPLFTFADGVVSTDMPTGSFTARKAAPPQEVIAYPEVISGISALYLTSSTDRFFTESAQPVTVSSVGGNDVLAGWTGDDILVAGSGFPRLFGGDGNDVLIAGTGVSELNGGAGVDTFAIDAASFDNPGTAAIIADFTPGETIEIAGLTGGFSALNTSTDNNGNARVTLPGGGLLRIDGVATVAESDFSFVASPRVFAPDSDAPDEVVLTNATDRFFADGSSAALTITAGGGNDLVLGGAGGDFIAGGDGFDFLFGGSGNDTLQGGTGTDNLSGGAGDDTFLFDVTDAPTSGQAGAIIADFRADGASDLIRLVGFGFTDVSDLSPSFNQNNGSTTLTLVPGQWLISLQNTDVASLSNADFEFA